LVHLTALYWERASELWTSGERIKWLQAVATQLLTELEAALGITDAQGGGSSGGASGGGGSRGGASGGGGSGDLLSQLRSATERVQRWYPPGGGNPYHGFEFASLRAEQVVIPEEEQPAEQPNRPPQPEAAELPQVVAEAAVGVAGDVEDGGGDHEGAAVGGDSGAGGGAGAADGAVLAPLLEEAEALTTRVDEMERLTARGCAPAMRTLVSTRLASSEERLTLLMCSIDGAVVGEGARDAKRALTRRMDALGLRLAAIAVD
jgi:hypothetical protein